jgi:hypothetical protein
MQHDRDKYGDGPQIGETLILGVGHNYNGNERFPCFFRGSGETRKKVAIYNGLELNLKCECHGYIGSCRVEIVHEGAARDAATTYFVNSDGDRIERNDFAQAHHWVEATVITAPGTK